MSAGDENLGLSGKAASGESEEVMLSSDPRSGEESSPGELGDYDYGERDDDAAEDYAKKTTTETELEDYSFDESVMHPTAVPEPQVMGIQSNVVPASMEGTRLQSPPGEDIGENSGGEEGILELSVGQPSLHADGNSDADIEDLNDPVLGRQEQQQQAPEMDFPAPDTVPSDVMEDEGSVKITEEEEDQMSPQGSGSLSFDNSEHHPATSPVMFAAGEQEHEEGPADAPKEMDMSTTERDLDFTDFLGLGKTTDAEMEVDSMKQTMKTMNPETEEKHKPMDEKELKMTEESEKPVDLQPPARMQEPLPSGSTQAPAEREVSAVKKGGLTMLPPKRTSGTSKPASGTTTQARSLPQQPPPEPQVQPPPPQPQPQPPAAVPQPQPQPQPQPPAAVPQPQPQPQQQPRNPPAPPAGIGLGAALPRRNVQPPAQPQQQVQRTLYQRPTSAEGQRAVSAGNGGEGSSAVESPEIVETRRKLLDIRLKMLRIAVRLAMKPMDFGVSDFMTKIDRTEQLRFRGQGPIRPQLDVLYNQAIQLDERSGPDSNLEMTVTAVVLGPKGSGKSSVIRNILHPGPGLAPDFASEPTEKIEVVTGRVCGVNFKLIDTPGLSVAASALRKNMNILKKVKAAVQKHKPDTVIYVDRMDLFRRELSDIPLLRLVNDMLPELLYNCIALLTRASAPPPDAGHGNDMPYTEYQRLRLDLCTQIITHAISDMRWAGRPLGFENHPRCSVNREGVPVLPSGQTFKKHTIFQLISSHMSRQVEAVCKTRQLRQRTMEQMMLMMQPRKQLQLSALVSQLLAPKPPKKFPDEERELMTKREIRKMTSENDRVEEENKRRDYTRLRKVEILQEEAHPSQVPIVGANMELSPSFDHEVNQHRYNATDFVYGWSVRPVMAAQDNIYEHDDGVEMCQIARDGVMRWPGNCVDGLPYAMIVQAGKGKNLGNVQMDGSFSHYATRNIVTSAGVVIHPAGQDGEVVYTPTVDVRAKIAEKDKITFGGMACRLAESGSPLKGQLGLGGKVENKYKIREGVKVTASSGVMTVKPASGQARDVAYGANMELKWTGGKGEYDPNYLISGGVSHQRRGTLKRTGFSGQLSIEQAISPETMLNGRVQLSAGGSGTSSLRMITHDKPQFGILMAVPLIIKVFKRFSGYGDEFV